MDVAIFTVTEVQREAPQRFIDEPALERRLKQTARRQTRQAAVTGVLVHQAQPQPLIVCQSNESELP